VKGGPGEGVTRSGCQMTVEWGATGEEGSPLLLGVTVGQPGEGGGQCRGRESAGTGGAMSALSVILNKRFH
jgi:hypothetical protein